MLSSMTAFARGFAGGPWGQVTWELRTVNHRFCEISFRLPELFREKEIWLRKRLQDHIQRGKVDCILRYTPSGETGQALQLNRPFVQQLQHICQELEASMPNLQPLKATDLLRWPEALLSSTELDEALWGPVQGAFEQTLAALQVARHDEGRALLPLLQEKLTQCEAIRQAVIVRLPQIQAHIKERLYARVAELKEVVDGPRMEQELLLLVHRMDVQEELERLQTHLAETSKTLTHGKQVGRRLDFLMQELNREANTLGSKSNDAFLTQSAIELKVLIEQMREQMQNLE